MQDTRITSPRLAAGIERLAWILVYGGLFSALLGWVSRREDAATGAWLLAAGAAAAVLGVVLIVVRSRMRTAAGATPSKGRT